MKKNLKNLLIVSLFIFTFLISGCTLLDGVTTVTTPILDDIEYSENITLDDIKLPTNYEWKTPTIVPSVDVSSYTAIRKEAGKEDVEVQIKLNVLPGTPKVIQEPTVKTEGLVMDQLVTSIENGLANTEGTFTLNESFNVIDGKNTFNWTFTPSDVNYKGITGSTEFEVYFENGPHNIVNDIVNWKKVSLGLTKEDNLFESEDFLKGVGTSGADWWAFGLGRAGINDLYDGYLTKVTSYIETKYQKPTKLDATRATEWHRITYAVAALGGDPTHIETSTGEVIDLINDGTYNRGLTKPVDAQGLNGWIFGLLALDVKSYEVPADAFNSREDFIVGLLQSQLEDGGWALWGNVADIDMTAMTLQALSRYYNSEKVYEYTSKTIKVDGEPKVIKQTVKEACDQALATLSKMQDANGGYSSWGSSNTESACQVLTALSALNIDARKDERFIKGGSSLYDAILEFKTPEGGFSHVANSPTNSMSSEQALYSFVAYLRYSQKMRTVYDMLPEFTKEEQLAISEVEQKISTITESSSIEEVIEILNTYLQIPLNNRRYVSNYWTLSDSLKKLNIELPSELFY